MMSSVTPSRRYSSSFWPERCSKYRTAIDFWAVFWAPLFASPGSAARLPPESVFRRSRRRSVFSSVALWYRRARSFSSAFSRSRPSSAGRAGTSWVIGGGSRLRMASNTTAEVSPWKGRTPVAIW